MVTRVSSSSAGARLMVYYIHLGNEACTLNNTSCGLLTLPVVWYSTNGRPSLYPHKKKYRVLYVPKLSSIEIVAQKNAYDNEESDGGGCFGAYIRDIQNSPIMNVSVISKIYNAIPHQFLVNHPQLSDFFYHMFITIAPNDPNVPAYKAYKYGNITANHNLKLDFLLFVQVFLFDNKACPA